MTSHEDPRDGAHTPVDPVRALDELEERVLGRNTDHDRRDEHRTEDSQAEPGPVDGESGTGVDAEPTD
ncbi:hypothetical protein [Pseudonocardia sp. NPDC049635]|uniref:hypothetical protein n=1 Tax=Pseudonocardia sp. NPDC049635 TaxID=3155506 RepID=UPI0034035CA8